MLKLRLIKRTFVRQQSLDDCGTACLSMLLNYTGRTKEAKRLKEVTVPVGGFSLLDLKCLAESSGLKARSVEMEIDFLRRSDHPCILHLQNDASEDHYQVCYGRYGKGKQVSYLMADPAKQVYMISEDQLKEIWLSGAALYVDPLEADFSSFRRSSWQSLLAHQSFPIAIWCLLPLLSMMTASTGIALSVFLQKAAGDSRYLSGRMLLSAMVLLLVIGFYRVFMGYVRGRLLMKMSTSLYSSMMARLFQRFFSAGVETRADNQTMIDYAWTDIAKIQLAFGALISIWSDGVMVGLLLLIIAWYLPVAAIVNMLSLILVSALSLSGVIKRSFANIQLNQLFNANKTMLVADLNKSQPSAREMLLDIHNRHCLYGIQRYLRHAVLTAKHSSLLELVSTVNIVAVLAYSMNASARSAVYFADAAIVVLATFMIGALLPKIFSMITMVDEGADAAIQFDRMMS